jgi:hypothetical protein
MYYDVNMHWATLAVGFARASNEHWKWSNGP